MPITVAKTSFAAGVVAPEYRGRTEAPFYAEGVAVADNWQVLPSGAARVRPGTRVVARVNADGLPRIDLLEVPLRMFVYRDLVQLENDFLIIMGSTRMQAVRRGALQRAGLIKGADGLNLTNHGYADVNGIRVSQSGTQMIFTSNEREPMVLEPGSALRQFTFRPYRFGDPRDSAPVAELTSVTTKRVEDPGQPAGEISARADIALRNAGALYLVTVVDENGREYNYGRPKSSVGSYNYSSIRAAANVKWESHPRASFYRLYRSAINPQTTELYTPGSIAANAEENRVKTEVAHFRPAGATNATLAVRASTSLTLSGNATAFARIKSDDSTCLEIPVKSKVNLVLRYPITINSILSPDSAMGDTEHVFEIVLTQGDASGTQKATRHVWQVTTDADLGTSTEDIDLLKNIELTANDIDVEAGDCFKLAATFKSSHAGSTAKYTIPALSAFGDLQQLTVYSRDRETVPVQPMRAAFVPVDAGLGLLAETRGTSFTDYNYLPDFSINPPTHDNPFAEARLGALASVQGANQNINLAEIQTPVALRRGVTPVIDRDGILTGAYVKDAEIEPSTVTDQERINKSKAYEVRTVATDNLPAYGELEETLVRSVTASTGVLTFDLDLGADYPQCSAVFQQRRIFAGGARNGSRIWGSRVGDHTDFSLEQVPTDSGPWQFDIDVSTEADISHMVPVSLGLLLFTTKGVWLLSSGAEGTAITATQNSLSRQSSFGCAETIEPLLIGNEVYYVDASRTSIIRLQYSRESRQYSGVRTTRLVEHLLRNDNRATSWAYARSPDSRLYVTLEDGTLLDAYVNEDSGAMSFSTRSAEESTIDWRLVETVATRDRDEVYFAVERSWLTPNKEAPDAGIDPDYRYAPTVRDDSTPPVAATVEVSAYTEVLLEPTANPAVRQPYFYSWVRINISIEDDSIRGVVLQPPRGSPLRAGLHRYAWQSFTRGVSDGSPITGVADGRNPFNGLWTVNIDGVSSEAHHVFNIRIPTAEASFGDHARSTIPNRITDGADSGTSIALTVTADPDGVLSVARETDVVADNHFLVQETPNIYLDMQYPIINQQTLTGLHALEGAKATVVEPGTTDLLGNANVSSLGSVDLGYAVLSGAIGVPYRALLQTLKPVYSPRDSVTGVDIGIDAFRKLILDVWVDVLRTKGLMVGRTPVTAVDLDERVFGVDNFDDVPRPDTAGQFYLVPTQWDNEARMYVIQERPLGGLLLSVSFNIDLTDPRQEGAAAILTGASQ